VVRLDGEYTTLGTWPFLQVEVARLMALEMLREVELKKLRSRFPEVASLMFGGEYVSSASETAPTKPRIAKAKASR
jgi:hypothetical protein